MQPFFKQRRHLSFRRAFAGMLVVGSLLLIAGAVEAALPEKGTRFLFHDHETAERNWHVEFRIHPKDRQRIKTLVAHSQQCDVTVAKQGVPISEAGVVAATGPAAGGGTWEVNATFEAPTKLVGTMRVQSGACDTGVLSYPNAVTGDGHADHDHGGGGHAHGNQGPKFSDFASATAKERRQAGVLHRRVLKRWSGLSLAEAKRRRFFRDRQFQVKLGVFHTYNQRNERDRRIFDAKRPESLVFWRPAEGEPVLLGPMFRVGPGRRPRFAGPIPIYHYHPTSTGKILNKMTHVWLTKGLKMAWANCLPITALKQHNPGFEFMPGAMTGTGGTC